MTRATLPLASVCRVYFMDTNLCSRRCTLAAAAAAAVEESAAGWGCPLLRARDDRVGAAAAVAARGKPGKRGAAAAVQGRHVCVRAAATG